MVFCGIDVGTQGARCVLLRDDGEPVGQAHSAFEQPALPAGGEGWFEQAPEDWLRAVSAAARGAVEQMAAAGLPAESVKALSVTGTSGTLCAVGERGEAVCPAIM